MKEEHIDEAAADLIIEPRLFCWGSGAFGQHGHVIDDNICPIDGFLQNPSADIVSVACGACYSFVLKGDGSVLGWGSNQNGQIGCSHQRQCLTPTRSSIENVQQVSAGDRHTLFLLRDGSVRGCGCNFYAQLSVDTLEELQRQDKPIPFVLSLHEKVTQVACGQYHSLLLYEGGEVAAVGRNIYGQLGVPMPEGVKTDVLETPALIECAFKSAVATINAGQNHSVAIDDAGRCYVWGYCRACGSRGSHVTRPKLLDFPHCEAGNGNASSLAMICASGGASHSLFLAHGRRRLFAIGCNLDGQCGLGASVSFATRPVALELDWTAGAELTAIDCAENFSCAVTSSRELWMWGRNSGVLPGAAAAAATVQVAPSESEAPRIFAPRRVPVPFAVLSAACGNWHAAVVVNYREPKDVSHLPGGRSNRRTPAVPPQVEVSTEDAWVDIRTSRMEQAPLQPAAPSGADSSVSPLSYEPLALEDVDDVDRNETAAALQAQPPQLPSATLAAQLPRPPAPDGVTMRRTKSLNRVLPGGEGRQPMRLRRVQPPSPAGQLGSELVHVYRLVPGGSGRPGTATYHAQPTIGPPLLDQRRAWPGAPVPAGELRQPQLIDTAATAEAASASASAKSTLMARRAVGTGVKLGSQQPLSLPPGAAIRGRPFSASGGGGGGGSSSSGGLAAMPAPPVRQNLASLRRRSSAGRLGTGGGEVT